MKCMYIVCVTQALLSFAIAVSLGSTPKAKSNKDATKLGQKSVVRWPPKDLNRVQ